MTPANNISLEKIQLGLSTPKKVTTLAVISVDFRSGIKRKQQNKMAKKRYWLSKL